MLGVVGEDVLEDWATEGLEGICRWSLDFVLVRPIAFDLFLEAIGLRDDRSTLSATPGPLAPEPPLPLLLELDPRISLSWNPTYARTPQSFSLTCTKEYRCNRCTPDNACIL